MDKGEKEKVSINVNPEGILEIEEFKNRMALFRKGRRSRGYLKKKK